jgi:nicotinamide-nucleotide amidase
MKIEAVIVGNELLNGDLADTNTATFGRLLRGQGLRLLRGQTVPDDAEAIASAVQSAALRSDLVLISGGLGPTEDDITVASVAQSADLPMVRDHQALETLRARYEGRGFKFTMNNAKQVDHPEGGVLLPNAKGTAPGVRLRLHGSTLFFFPGVPRELSHLAERHLLPWLQENATIRPYQSVIFKTFGWTESMVAEHVRGLGIERPVHVAYRAHFPEIHVSLHALGDSEEDSAQQLHTYAHTVREELGPLVFTEDPSMSLAQVVIKHLEQRSETVALGESCTGGLVAKMLTDVPGSSATVLEGIVAYSNASKIARLRVDPALIERHGAVSEEVARAMAEGARASSGATWGVGITGIAGPGGGTESKPTGLVHIAIAHEKQTKHVCHAYPFGRERTRVVSAYAALDMIRRF